MKHGEVRAAASLAARMAPVGLTPRQARLYSHVTRLRAGRTGVRWSEADTAAALDDAVHLIEAGRVLRDSDFPDWQRSFRRAAEILEWLSELDTLRVVPAAMLSAAAYQIAGYPAQALGLLSREEGKDTRDSGLLRSLLQADFPALEEGLRAVWAVTTTSPLENQTKLPEEWIADRVVDEVFRVFGVFCAYMRWGDATRLQAAVERMDEIAGLMARAASPTSWLLARLTAEVIAGYAQSALRGHVAALLPQVDAEGRIAFERYLRRAYLNGRALAWPSQVRGIQSLVHGGSFALCTPTGSGKTTVAELGILKSLFQEDTETENFGDAPLVLYITPTKALAAEVEGKLAAVVQGLSSRTLQVTGLYGGTDWGPSEAWLTTSHPTVLICTQEKADALVRFLGPLFVRRIRLIVVDEAHQVQWPESPQNGQTGQVPRGNVRRERFADSRGLRLESLLSRLLTYGREDCHVIALSAVAGGIENVLARWLTGDPGALAAIEPYRSTRQLVGKLVCEPSGAFRIEYDLLNGSHLTLEGRDDQPHVPNPFARVPGWRPNWSKPEVALREPTLWAALQAAGAGGDRPQSVLVFVPERAPHLAKTLVELLEGQWGIETIPYVFQVPVEGSDAELWGRCRAACADFFGANSYEYRLLNYGVVLHHGKMPPSLGRLLVEVVERRITSVVLATSTLSEGVNLPFETVIFAAPSRSGQTLDVRAVANTIGRAGRPGYGTEGRALFVLPQGHEERRWKAYRDVIEALATDTGREQAPLSPLALALIQIRDNWRRLHLTGSEDDFFRWLETTAPADAWGEDARDALEAVDQILIAVNAEMDQFDTVSGADLEDRLKAVWRWTYARYAAQDERRLSNYFVRRGVAVRDRLYPNAADRRRIYVTSLPPRDAQNFLDIFPEIRNRLGEGFEYAAWERTARADFLERVLEVLWTVPAFTPTKAPGGNRGSWQATLRWWLRAPAAPTPPSPTDVSMWFKHVADNYLYRGAWGIGNAIALATYELHAGELLAPTLDEWPKTGLPWVTLWIKEMLTWGTLDPAASVLLATRRAGTRTDAEGMAEAYYQSVAELSPDERLHPSRIKTWVDGLSEPARGTTRIEADRATAAEPIPEFPADGSERWRVWPVASAGQTCWVDPAGYPLAESSTIAASALDPRARDYWFEPVRSQVRSNSYLRAE